MQVLVVGGGGREHALAWKVSCSKRVNHVYVAPGNAGTSFEPGVTNVAIGAEDIDELCAFALREGIDLAIIGPEVPLTLGITDRFQEHGLRCFGPTASAARLEGSKDFTKRFLARQGIPTARFQTFDEVGAACDYIDHCHTQVVVKADGLAAGKGVVVAESKDQAKRAVSEMLARHSFGAAGERVVIEDRLQGEEVSYICVVDGKDVVPLAASQDHKAAFDGDTGPNTGGMGAYSPAPILDASLEQRILGEVIHPTVRGLMNEGIRFTGFLYAGLMISDDGTPNVLEYNCRLGDPETQPLLFRMKSDLVELILAALNGTLDGCSATWDERAALGVVVASQGYPGDYARGAVISGLDTLGAEDVKVFHAGTACDDAGNVIVNGGRVLCVTAIAPEVRLAQSSAYDAISRIAMEGMHYRTDIGHRALAHELNS